MMTLTMRLALDCLAKAFGQDRLLEKMPIDEPHVKFVPVGNVRYARIGSRYVKITVQEQD